MKIATVTPPTTGAPSTTTAASAVAPHVPSKKARELEHAAKEFEAIFVRQLLNSSKVAGKENAYSDMAVDALAQSMSSGRGLGLASQIQEALNRTLQLEGPKKK